jgi:glutathione S-transferase
MSLITLYSYATSPFAMKVGCYLKYKKLDFTFVPVNPIAPIQIKFTEQRLCDEFIEHVDGGPFLGQRTQISLADLSAYPTIVSGHLMGMFGQSPFLAHQQIIDWCKVTCQIILY